MKGQFWKSFVKASPLILTIIGSIGVAGTAIMAVKCKPKAEERIKIKEEEKGEPLTVTEKALAVAPVYLPAAGVGILTVASIVGSNLLSRKQNLAMAGALAMVEHNYHRYRSKVKELLGEATDQKVREEISKEELKFQNVGKPEFPNAVLWYEENTGQPFWAEETDVLRSEMEVNRRLATEWQCTLAEYCNLLDIQAPEGSDVLGWSYEDFVENWDEGFGTGPWVDFWHEFVESPDELMPPYYIIHTAISPYWNFELDRRVDIDLEIDENGCYTYDVR